MTDRQETRTTPVTREVLSERVKDRILTWILEGELEPGSRIVETRVARELGVSQAPVREALRDLAILGFVEMKPHKGARVRNPTREELTQAIEVRAELEALGGRLAAVRRTERCLSDLEELAAAYGYGLATSHPFNDGNKRVSFLAMYVFLGLNGLEIEAAETEVVELVVAVASGRCCEEDLADWLRGHISPLNG